MNRYTQTTQKQLPQTRKLVKLFSEALIFNLLVLITSAVASYQSPLNNLPPEYFPDSLAKAVAAHNSGEFKTCLKKLEKKRKNFPDTGSLYKILILKGLCSEGTGNSKLALKCYDKSLQFRGSNSDALYLSGRLLNQMKRTEEALTRLEESLWFERYELTSPALTEAALGLSYIENGNIARAEPLLTRSLKSSPLPETVIALSHLRLEQGRKKEALDLLEKQREKVPERKELQLELARACLYKADRKINRKDIERAHDLSKELYLKLDSEMRCNTESTSVYLHSLVNLGKLDIAETEVEQLLKQCPDSASLITIRTQIKTEKKALEVKSAEGSEEVLMEIEENSKS